MSAPVGNLPPMQARFIGREREIERLRGMLTQPDCRFVTLVGPGGIGKTRLAMRLGHELTSHFPDGVYFSGLHVVPDSDSLIRAIGSDLSLSLAGGASPAAQVAEYLYDKRALLILDNFEHLLDGAPLLADILKSAPNIKMLITSREVLNLSEEWLWPVNGLTYPNEELGDTPPDSFSAIRLFNEVARRVRPDFWLYEHLADVIRICQIVEGMPLAIELAASWLRALPCSAIVGEIERGIDILSANLRDLPERHRSIRAVFDRSWQLMSPMEREVFSRLSIFRGGFSLDAAMQVANASLPLLATLVDKSLIRRGADGRYDQHELLRQYSQEQLMRATMAIPLQSAHSDYYANFLANRTGALMGGKQVEALKELEAEYDNIRAAWNWAVQMRDVSFFERAMPAMDQYFQFKARYMDGVNAYESAIAALEPVIRSENQQALFQLLLGLSAMYLRFGRLAEAEALVEKITPIYEGLKKPVMAEGSDPVLMSAMIAGARGEHEAAFRLAQLTYERSSSKETFQPWNLQLARSVQANATLNLGDFAKAQALNEEAHALTLQTGAEWYRAYVLNDLGHVAFALGNYAEAKERFQQSYTIREAFGDSEGMALALSLLGKVALKQHDYRGAETLFRQSLAWYRQIGDQGGLVTALNGLGSALCSQEAYDEARALYKEAIQRACKVRLIPYAMRTLIGIARLYLETGWDAHAADLLVYVLNQQGLEKTSETEAQALLRDYELRISPKAWTLLRERLPIDDLDALCDGWVAELNAWRLQATPIPARKSPSGSLNDPLTEREHEILRLLAEGASNQEIAERLTLVVGTVKAHNHSIFGKLGVSNRTQAIARARELNLL